MAWRGRRHEPKSLWLRPPAAPGNSWPAKTPRIPRKRSLRFGCHRFEYKFSESHTWAIDTNLTVTPGARRQSCGLCRHQVFPVLLELTAAMARPEVEHSLCSRK